MHKVSISVFMAQRSRIAASVGAFFAAGPPQGKKRPLGGQQDAQRRSVGAFFAAGPPQGKKRPLGGQQDAQRRSVGALFLFFLFVGPPAMAGVCSAPFMHNGGQTQLSGSGALALAANLAFSEVSKQGEDNCEARVVGDTSVGLMGMPASKSKLDYWLTVRNGKASFERREADGSRAPVNGKFDLRMLGLFAYGTPISRQGQTFPALKFQINVDRKAVQADPIVVRTGEKTVGARKTIQTASGSQACWPISYTRVIDATRASFNGLVLPIPAMTSAVTDWFCPALNMVMKQESVQSGISSTVEVTRLQ